MAKYRINPSMEQAKGSITCDCPDGSVNIPFDGAEVETDLDMSSHMEKGIVVLVSPAKAAPKMKRAREEDGQFKPDDPSTPDVNEAWEEVKEPSNPEPKKEDEKAPVKEEPKGKKPKKEEPKKEEPKKDAPKAKSSGRKRLSKAASKAKK